jgi:hypothetical protein
MNTSENKNCLELPVQVLNWNAFRNKKNLRKIYLQFELKAGADGGTVFGLVAYPAYKSGKTWSVGTKVVLADQEGSKLYPLSLPITLGNLELGYKEIQKLRRSSPKEKLIFKPRYYKKNPHAAYDVADESGRTTALANPTPPGRPSV